MKNKMILVIIILSTILSTIAQAGCTFPTISSRLWDNVESDLVVDISILSKVCDLASTINLIETNISGLSVSLSSEVTTIISFLEDIDTRVITIQSTVNDLDSFITGPINSKLNLIENNDLSILSLVNVIDTRTDSIYSLDQIISSDIDLEIETDETIFSLAMVIDSKISNVNLNCSGIDQILQIDESILSTVNVIDTRTSSIYNTDQSILSYVQVIDDQVITIQSNVNNLNSFITGPINSKLDLIEDTNLSIQSVVNVIDTRTSSIYSLDQTIASKVDNFTTLAESVQSAVNVVNSKIDGLGCIASLAGQLAQIDASILSTLMVIDTRTSEIQSVTNNIFSLDQIIDSNISTIITLEQSTCSKIEADISLDITTESILNNINSALDNLSLACSGISELIEVDQSILSVVNVIDTRTSNIQSNVTNIYILDQSISSQVDLDISIDNSTQSTVNVIDSKVNLIQTNIATVSQVTNATESIIDTLSTCCTGTGTNSETVLTSIYGTKIADQSYDNISIQFQYGVPSYSINSSTEGGGTVTSANSMAVLSTAASASSIAQIQTKNTITYRSGHEAYAYFSVAFTGSFAATSSQFIGPIDYQNGFAVGFDGTTFGITRRTDTVNTFTPQSQFNGDKLDGSGPSQFNYNPALLNIFRISYGYLGSSIIRFQILSTFGNWITFHTIQYPNSSSTPSIFQPFLPVTARVENLAGTSALTLQTASWNAGIVGEPSNNSFRYFQVNNTVTSTAGEKLVLTITNSAVFNNQPNKITVRLTGLGATPTADTGIGGSSALFQIRKNATVTGASYSDVSTGNSVVQVSTTGTYSAATGTLVWGYPSRTSANSFGIFYFTNNPYSITIFPGESLTLTTQNYTADVIGALFWEEQF